MLCCCCCGWGLMRKDMSWEQLLSPSALGPSARPRDPRQQPGPSQGAGYDPRAYGGVPGGVPSGGLERAVGGRAPEGRQVTQPSQPPSSPLANRTRPSLGPYGLHDAVQPAYGAPYGGPHGGPHGGPYGGGGSGVAPNPDPSGAYGSSGAAYSGASFLDSPDRRAAWRGGGGGMGAEGAAAAVSSRLAGPNAVHGSPPPPSPLVPT